MGLTISPRPNARRCYAQTMGRPGLPPGIYFRLLLIGYFEGIESERGIAWVSSSTGRKGSLVL